MNNDIINLTPFKEIKSGKESIYDRVDESFSAPPKVIEYLKTTKPYMMSPGIYKHPFKDMELLGPYYYTDGEYCWDRDTWKYVVKYHVTLPQEFIDKVMSDRGTEFLELFYKSDESWGKEIGKLKERPNTVCLLPEDAGDSSLEDF